MAHRDDEEIHSTDHEVALVELIRARGIELQRQGGRLAAPCPLCGACGRTLTIDPTSNTWACSGPCGVTEGTPVAFVVKAEGVSKRHALELLRSGVPKGLGKPPRAAGKQKGTTPTASTRRWLSGDFDPDAPDDELLGQVVSFYHQALKASPEAMEYLEGRGLADPELIRLFRLGYSSRRLGYHLPQGNRKAGAAIRLRLRDLGIYRKSNHEHFSGSLVVPVTTATGEVVQLYARKVGPKLRAGTPLHLWLPRPERPLFNPTAFESAEVIVTASIIDALTLCVSGFRNTTAIAGFDAPTDELLKAIKTYTTKKTVLAFRRSDEGQQAATTLGDKLGQLGVEVHRMVLPAGMDCNDFARSTSDPKDGFSTLLRNTEWLAGKPSRLNVGTARTTSTTTPTMPTTEVVTPKVSDDELLLSFDDRRWRVRGLSDNRARGTLRLNVFVSREGGGFHVDVFDLYSARHRTAFIRLAATELGVDEPIMKKDLGAVLLNAEMAQDDLLCRLQQPEPHPAEMTDDERAEAMALLQDPQLLDRIKADFTAVGIVGEESNLLLGYLVATSRLLQRPLAVLVQSSSAAGKSSLMEAVLSFVPEEHRQTFSAMTGQSLFYMGGSALKQKVLSIAEEEGATKASYSLKVLQSEGALSIASTGKDPGTGRLVSHEYKVEGPVAIMMTTTSIDIDDELLSRCLVLTVDESPEQTARIHDHQRRAMTIDGLRADHHRDAVLMAHGNAQRLLRPVRVVLPHPEALAFPDLRVRARRDHKKLLGLVEVLAVLHQHQRDTKSVEQGANTIEYIEATDQDVELALTLMDHIGGVGVDDLPPATKKLLVMIDGWVSKQAKKAKVKRPEIRFSRRQLREALGVGDTQCKVHLRRLVDAEYVLAHPAEHGRGVVYGLAFNGDGYTYHDDRSGYGRGKVGPRSGVGRGGVGPTQSKPSPARARASSGPRTKKARNSTSMGKRSRKRTVGVSGRGGR